MIYLFPAALIAFAAAYVSYSEYVNREWFLPAMLGAGAFNAYFWGLAAKYAETKQELFIVSAAWDVMLIAAYTIMPFVSGFVELTWQQVIGIAIMLVGFAVVKYA